MKKIKASVSLLLISVISAVIFCSCDAQPPTEKVTTGVQKIEMEDKYGYGETTTTATAETVTDKNGKTVTDKNGEAVTKATVVTVTDKNGEAVTKATVVTVTDKNGEAVTDKKGEAVTKATVVTVTDKNGEAVTEKVESTSKSTSIYDVEFQTSSYYKCGENYCSISNIRFDDTAIAANAYGFVDFNMSYVGDRNAKMRIKYVAYDADNNIVRDSFVMAKLDGVKSGDTVTGARFDIPYNTVKVVFSQIDE